MWAIIGGTGLSSLEAFTETDTARPDTPYGPPSALICRGRLAGQPAAFLARHGTPHAIPPHRINYRANIHALRTLGAEAVIAVNAVGGIDPALTPGSLVLCDQVVDYTWGREHTFYDGSDGSLEHVDMTAPYDPGLRAHLLAAAEEAGVTVVPHGVYAATQGPRLETPAEIRRLARDGCDVVGMTGMPEAALAREAGLRYATLCLVVNPAAGVGAVPITMDAIQAVVEEGMGRIRALLLAGFRRR